ncbi:MAG: hypothetical protein LBD78_05710 [Spirochaetaceae bacterium]|jgi:hypothetical protein|nr:hypothetical protein [Spirochaetaceae bacterium]
MGWLDPVRGLFDRAIAKLREFLPSVAELRGGRHKRGLIFLSVLVLALLVTFLVVVLVNRSSRRVSAPGDEISKTFQPSPIPAEELFLPGEPDFLPGVVLERERREGWTAEDAAPFWTDPMNAGPEGYVDSIRGVVDEMMERIP